MKKSDMNLPSQESSDVEIAIKPHIGQKKIDASIKAKFSEDIVSYEPLKESDPLVVPENTRTKEEMLASPVENDSYVEEDGTIKRYDGKDWSIQEKKLKKRKYGDDELSNEEVLEAIKDSKNKSEWETNLKNKDKSHAEFNKLIDPVKDILKNLKGDNAEEIRELIEEKFGEDAVNALSKLDLEAKYDHPHIKENADYKVEIEKKDDEIFNLKLKWAFMKKHQVSPAKADEVFDAAEKRAKETGEILTMDSAYILMRGEKPPANVPDSVSTPPVGQQPVEIQKPKKLDGIPALRRKIKAGNFDHIKI